MLTFWDSLVFVYDILPKILRGFQRLWCNTWATSKFNASTVLFPTISKRILRPHKPILCISKQILWPQEPFRSISKPILTTLEAFPERLEANLETPEANSVRLEANLETPQADYEPTKMDKMMPHAEVTGVTVNNTDLQGVWMRLVELVIWFIVSNADRLRF